MINQPCETQLVSFPDTHLSKPRMAEVAGRLMHKSDFTKLALEARCVSTLPQNRGRPLLGRWRCQASLRIGREERP